MHLWQVSLAGNSGSLIGHLPVAFGGAPNFDVTNSLDDAYLGPFNINTDYRFAVTGVSVSQQKELMSSKI